jgi:hypothetical protein
LLRQVDILKDQNRAEILHPASPGDFRSRVERARWAAQQSKKGATLPSRALFRVRVTGAMSYCDIHRAVLQLMMHKGAIEEQEALKTVQDLARKLSPAGLGESDIPTEPTTLK